MAKINSFAKDLWDQIETLEEFSGNGITSMNSISNCLKAFANAEFECSRATRAAIASSQADQKKLLAKLPPK
jgi:hypothetical protein